MKKLLFFFIVFCGLIFPQNGYEARINIFAIWWHSDIEFQAYLHSDLYLNGTFLRPYIDYDPSDYSYFWERKENGIWISHGNDIYLKNTDGHQNTIYPWRVTVTGPGISDMSEVINVVKYGYTKNVANVNAFKENGTSANTNVKIREWAEYSWIDWAPGNTIHRFLTLDGDNILKDSIISSFGQKFIRWETITPAINYYTNYAGIQVGDITNDINVYHKSYKGTSFNLISDIQSLKMQFKDPWVTKTTPDYYQSPIGYKNLGLNAIYENVNNGGYNPIFLNQNPQFDPNLPTYSISIPSSIYLTQTGKTHNLYLQSWSYSGATLQNPNSLNTGVVFTSSGSSVTANVKATQISDNINTFANNSQRKAVRTTDGIMQHCYQSINKVWYERSSDNGTTWNLGNGGMPVSSLEAKNPSADFSYSVPGIVYQEKNGDSYKIKMAYFYSNGNMFNSYDVQAQPGIILIDSVFYRIKPGNCLEK